MNDQPNEKTDTKWMGAGLFAAFVASLCCITPVAAFMAGIGGIGSTFAWIEPIRPWLIGISVLLLGFAWYQKLKPQWDPECACEEHPSFWHSKSFLGIVTVLTSLLLTFPYYSDAFFPDQTQNNIVYVQESQVRTITMDIEGMTCTGCETTVEKAASGVDGVLEVDVSHDTGKATVKYDKSRTNLEAIAAAINKTGFTVNKDSTN